ncbi:unnamed protein product [Trifolium pratense]|uniref:Uncharacterized protein n=1 Tax=Trifolium pratense TaxID=57577 RepID=A0ACB0JC07_TRIPR|nr:unnamed protein product [Trifolium pratense]
MSGRNEHVPLSVLLKRELANEKMDKSDMVVVYSQASENKKGEDFTLLKNECQRVVADGVSTYSVFGLFDGHNGSAAAIYAKENLLNNVLSAIPTDLNRDEWIKALPRALVAGFVKTDKDFQQKAQSSGTTVTLVILEGWVITVASVGDSRCILEPSEGGLHYLSADHRLDTNEEERVRITSCGGEVGRLNTGGGAEVGPLRCWPGGLCLSRSIGDMDVGEFIVPVPHVKQVKLSTSGGRLVISSDGVWDALTAEMVLDCCRGMSAEAAAPHIVKESLHAKGLRDDTTCIVVDILPQEKPPTSVPSQKRPVKGMLKAIFRKKSSEPSSYIVREYVEPDMVRELFEEGSAMLSERFETKYPLCNMFKMFVCAVCQVEIKPGEGISVHEDAPNQGKPRPWDGPFLCSSCQEKKQAMEGRRTSGVGGQETKQAKEGRQTSGVGGQETKQAMEGRRTSGVGCQETKQAKEGRQTSGVGGQDMKQAMEGRQTSGVGCQETKQAKEGRQTSGVGGQEMKQAMEGRQTSGVGCQETKQAKEERQTSGVGCQETKQAMEGRQTSNVGCQETKQAKEGRQTSGVGGQEIKLAKEGRQTSGVGGQEMKQAKEGRQTSGVGCQETKQAKEGKQTSGGGCQETKQAKEGRQTSGVGCQETKQATEGRQTSGVVCQETKQAKEGRQTSGVGGQETKQAKEGKQTSGVGCQETKQATEGRRTSGVGCQETKQAKEGRQTSGVGGQETKQAKEERQTSGVGGQEMTQAKEGRQTSGVGGQETKQTKEGRQTSGVGCRETKQAMEGRQTSGVDCQETKQAKEGRQTSDRHSGRSD